MKKKIIFPDISFCPNRLQILVCCHKFLKVWEEKHWFCIIKMRYGKRIVSLKPSVKDAKIGWYITSYTPIFSLKVSSKIFCMAEQRWFSEYINYKMPEIYQMIKSTITSIVQSRYNGYLLGIWWGEKQNENCGVCLKLNYYCFHKCF